MVVGSGPAGSSSAAKEFQPNCLSHSLDFPNCNGADLARGPHVGAAAGAPIEVADGHDPEVPVRPDGFLSPAADSASSKLTYTGRFWATTSLARSSARRPAPGSAYRSRGPALRSPGQSALPQ